MRMIRVIHCLGQLNTGGAETLVMNVLRNIDKSKVHFDFLLFNDKPGVYDQEVKAAGCALFYTPSLGNAGIIKYIKEMIRFFEKENPDVVHSHMDWQGGFIAYAAHKAGVKKIIVHSHANQKMFGSDFAHKCIIKVSKLFIKKYATDLCACSKEAGESLFGQTDFQVINNGIDMKRYLNPDKNKIEQLKIEFGLKETDIVLGHVGSFSENKNQGFLIELLQELLRKNENYKLLLVGNGSLKPSLEQKVKETGLDKRVIFARVRLDIPEIMRLLDVFLFPSIAEGLGIVAVEAQASKLPCILSDTIPKEVDLGLGLVEYISLSEQEKWIECIERKVKESNVVDDRKIENSKFDIAITVKQLVKIYD